MVRGSLVRESIRRSHRLGSKNRRGVDRGNRSRRRAMTRGDVVVRCECVEDADRIDQRRCCIDC